MESLPEQIEVQSSMADPEHQQGKLARIVGRSLLALGLSTAPLAVETTLRADEVAAVTDTYPDSDAYDCSATYEQYAWCKPDGGGNTEFRSARGYWYRNCTDWAAWRIEQITGEAVPNTMGNGGSWDTSGSANGFEVDNTPEVGDAAVWDGDPGHVEVVESVNPDGTVNTSGYNKAGTGTFGQQFGVTADHYVDFDGSGTSVSPLQSPTANIWAFNERDFGSNSTAVHVIDSQNPNSESLLSSGTGLHQTDSDWDFDVADYNGDGTPDIWSFNKKDAGSNSTAVHIIDGENVNAPPLSTGTGLHQTNGNWAFRLGDYNRDGTPDVYAINRKDRVAGRTSYHILDGTNLTGPPIFSSKTWLGRTNSNWDFDVADYNNDGTPDIYAINRKDAGSNSTAVHVIDGKNPNGASLLSSGTWLPQTTRSWSFRVGHYNGGVKPDIFAIDPNDAGSNSTALHVISGADVTRPIFSPSSTGTWLHQTDSDWGFAVG